MVQQIREKRAGSKLCAVDAVVGAMNLISCLAPGERMLRTRLPLMIAVCQGSPEAASPIFRTSNKPRFLPVSRSTVSMAS